MQQDGNHSAAQRLTRGDWCASRFTPLLAPSCCMSESEGTGCISALATCTGAEQNQKCWLMRCTAANTVAPGAAVERRSRCARSTTVLLPLLPPHGATTAAKKLQQKTCTQLLPTCGMATGGSSGMTGAAARAARSTSSCACSEATCSSSSATCGKRLMAGRQGQQK